MIVPHSFGTLLTRTVELFRRAEAKEDQKTQFRALLALLKGDAVTLRVESGALEINGEPVRGTAYEPLVARLTNHRIEELAITPNPPPGQMFEVLRALAEAPSEPGIAERLWARGVDKIVVRVGGPAAPPPAMDLGAGDVVQGAELAQWSAPTFTPSEDRTPGATDAAPVGDKERTVAPPTLDETLAVLERDPRAGDVGTTLEALVHFAHGALRSRRAEHALRIVAAVVRAEELATEGSLRRQYALALKRIYTKELLEALAQLVAVPAHATEVQVAFRRAGAEGVEVLLDLLVAAPTVGERQAIFGALRDMKEGADQVVHMLEHPQWFVVRNVAELLGELGLEDAVPALAKVLDHEDERVRKAVALALAKIGSRAAAEPLRRALRDKAPGVRVQAALGVGGHKSTALAMPLVVALEEEEDPEVERELILALGRIGSSDAVQALIKFAQPAGRFFGRRPTALRVTAVEALRVAATPAAIGTLQGLVEDGDKQVRGAAEDALRDLKT